MRQRIQGREAIHHSAQEPVVTLIVFARPLEILDAAGIDATDYKEHGQVGVDQQSGIGVEPRPGSVRLHREAGSRMIIASISPVSASIRKRLYCIGSAPICAIGDSTSRFRGTPSVMAQTSRPLYFSLS